MKKTFTALFLTLICIFGIKAQSPDSLTGPKVWLKADPASIVSSRWADHSFYKNDAAASLAVEMPGLTGVINYNHALFFDGLDDYLKIPFSLEGSAEFSFLVVFQSADTTERGIWGAESSLSRPALLTTRRAVGPDTISDAYGSNEKRAIVNSVVQNWDISSTNSPDAFIALGSAGKSTAFKPFQGSIAEMILFDRALTFVERIQYETYLAIKYGTGIKGGNLLSSDARVLWHGEQNNAYGNHIAGIGRDDHFGLYQKQSGSAYDSGLLVISAGPVAEFNEKNNTVIADQDFIVWGSNALPLTARRGDGADSVLSVIQRKWLATASGNTASKIATDVYVDARMFPSNPMGYWLVIDRSGRGNFSVDNLEYLLPDHVSNGRVVYKNVSWDTDLSGKDNFGFAQAFELFAVVRKVKNPSCTDEDAGQVRIEVIGGEAPFQYTLTNAADNIARSRKVNEKSSVESDLVEGEYLLTVTDRSKEAIDRTFRMVMPDALTIDLGPDLQLGDDQDLVLDVSAQVPDSIPVSYEWKNSFGFNSTDVKITVTESGVYRVFVTKENDGCVFTDDVVVSGDDGQKIAVYPTILSSNENYNIGVSLDEPGKVIVRIYNSRGLQINEIVDSGSSEYQFITSIKDSGVYLVVIQTPGKIETHKLVVN